MSGTLLSPLLELKNCPLLYSWSQIKFKAELGGDTVDCCTLVAMDFDISSWRLTEVKPSQVTRKLDCF